MLTRLEPDGDVPARAASDPSDGSAWRDVGLAQWVLAALLAGAGAVHVAMAPSHFGVSTAEGVGFLVAGWLQVALAAAVVVRPSRPVLVASATVSAAAIAAWAVSRTAGLPFGEHAGHAESVTVVDGIAVAMEAVAIVVAASMLSHAVLRFRGNGLALVAVVGVFALASAAIAAPSARDHAGATHGDHGAVAEGASRAATSTGSADGHDHGATTAAASKAPLRDLNGHVIKGVKAEDVAHELQPDEPLDVATRDLLAAQLVAAREAAMRYPTVADAERAGYRLVGGGFGPGAGAHYIGGGFGFGAFDPAKPPTLIYDGISPTSRVVGLMYLGSGPNGTAPEGFAGPNDHWHRHSGVCMRGAETIFPVDADVTEAKCTAAGGRYMKVTTWMVHAWVVPGWESPSGVFSHEHPNLRCADGTFNTDAIGRCQGT